jgi:hypothetical protein
MRLGLPILRRLQSLRWTSDAPILGMARHVSLAAELDGQRHSVARDDWRALGGAMSILTILLILLILGAFGGGYAGWYPSHYGFGGGGLLLLILIVLIVAGRL